MIGENELFNICLILWYKSGRCVDNVKIFVIFIIRFYNIGLLCDLFLVSFIIYVLMIMLKIFFF